MKLESGPVPCDHRGGPTRSRALPLINIPRTKNSQQRELETPYGQDLDGFGGVFMILKVSRQSEATLHDLRLPNGIYAAIES